MLKRLAFLALLAAFMNLTGESAHANAKAVYKACAENPRDCTVVTGTIALTLVSLTVMDKCVPSFISVKRIQTDLAKFIKARPDLWDLSPIRIYDKMMFKTWGCPSIADEYMFRVSDRMRVKTRKPPTE
jgi:hypothetical protein